MGKLEDKVAIITGAGAGIAKQIALLFAEEGARLALCEYDADKLAATTAELEAKGAEVFALPGDVTDEAALQDLVDGTVERFGTIDVLMNVATGLPPTDGPAQRPLLETPWSYFDAMYRGAVFSSLRLMQLCHPHLQGKESAVVNFGSSASLGVGVSAVQLGAYGTAKGAVLSLTRIAATEWGPDGIRVNAICPGAVTDTMKENAGPNLAHLIPLMSDNPLGRPGDPYLDIAPVGLFLASSDSRFVTGQVLHVSGGKWMAVL